MEAELRNIINAWEKLEHGSRSIAAVQRWLTNDMKPAIDRARVALGLPTTPDEE